MPKNKELLEICDDVTMRLEQVFHLGAQACVGDYPPTALEELIDDNSERISKVLGFDEQIDPDVMIEMIIDFEKFGFLVEAATPQMKYVSDSGASFSWGSYYTNVFYGETLEDAVRQAEKWVGEMRKKDRHNSGFGESS